MWSIEFWGLLVAGVGVMVNIVLFGAFWVQLRLLRRQVQQADDATARDHDRRKKQATIDFWAATQDRRLALAIQLPLDRDVKEIKKFLKEAGQGDNEKVRTLADFLGLYEMLATGINADVFDFELFAVMAGPRITSVVDNYGDWIQERRDERKDPLLYDELTHLASRLARRWAEKSAEGTLARRSN